MAATAADGDAVAALVATPEGARALEAFGQTIGVPSADVPRLARAAPRALADLGADAAVFTYVSPGWNPCPVLLAVHDATFMTNPEWLGARARAVLRGLVPRSAGEAALVLALSETAAGDVAAALAPRPAKVRVVSPHPDAVFRPRRRAPATGAVARTRASAWSATAWRSATSARARTSARSGRRCAALGDPGLQLALVGKPGPGRRADRRATAGGRWLGHVSTPTLADLYRAAAVTAYPSLYEGFGLPRSRRWRAAAPSSASDRGALPEVTGDAAILVEPTARGIAEGLRRGARPRGRGAAARRRARSGRRPTPAARMGRGRVGRRERRWSREDRACSARAASPPPTAASRPPWSTSPSASAPAATR